MKLKTLKDFENKQNDYTISRIELKAEAVKWVKELENKKIEINPKLRAGKNWNANMDMPIVWIKHFFNLTEEDLK